MATRIEYAHRKNEQRTERMPIRFAAQKVKAAILKVVKLLSFDGDNIFKSKKWPYY